MRFPLPGSASLLVEDADTAVAAEVLGDGDGEDEGGKA
jgi:hypothetical protein